jgi:hypothetical protein
MTLTFRSTAPETRVVIEREPDGRQTFQGLPGIPQRRGIGTCALSIHPARTGAGPLTATPPT